MAEQFGLIDGLDQVCVTDFIERREHVLFLGRKETVHVIRPRSYAILTRLIDNLWVNGERIYAGFLLSGILNGHDSESRIALH
jgi:hypothetical protein